MLGEICHLADSFASLAEFKSTSEFYEQLCYAKFDGKPITDFWQLSFVEVSDNIFTLLSQKLLIAGRSFIQQRSNNEILFHLQNGFVYRGKPLEEVERQNIIGQFCADDTGFDAVAQIQVNSHIGCQFGFIESRKLTPDILAKVIDSGYSGNSRIRFIEILKDANTPNKDGFKSFVKLLDNYQIPIKAVLPEKFKNKRVEEQRYSFVLSSSGWNDLNKDEKEILSLVALERIKFMKKEESNEWELQFKNIKEEYKDILISFTNAYSQYSVAAIISAKKIKNSGVNISEECEKLRNEISEVLSKKTIIRGNEELKRFANLYLTGNFTRNIEELLSIPTEIPEKAEMDIFTGGKAVEVYGSAKAHGIKALGFNNRTVNTLKNAENKISALFNSEIDMRKGLVNDTQGFNSCIYYDFGEYILSFDSGKLLNILAQANEFQHDDQHFQIIIDKKAFNYNLFGMNFEKINESVEGNFYFIQRNLKLIKSTGFRIFTTSIISQYHSHKEMLVFENCMPFVKAIGWDRIRIDEVEERLQELNMFLTLGSKKLISNVLAYAEDRRSIFSSFQELKEDDKVKARNSFTKFINNHKELSMSTMKNLAEIAIEMARPQSGSSSQETRIIRDSLNILKVCYKEKRDRSTSIGQMVGELRQLAKTYDYFNDSLALPFAESIYDNLFEKEWKNHFPQPSRLRNWVNEFGFWYSNINFELMKKNAIQKAIDFLKKENKDVNENDVIDWLKKSDSNKNKAVDKYQNEYRTIYRKYFNNNL